MQARRPARGLPALAGAAAAFLLGGALVGAGLARTPRGENAAMAARGAELYAGHCARCHGAALEGDAAMAAPPLDAAGHAWRHSDAQLASIIGRGLREPDEGMGMPGFAGQLDRAEIASLVAYVRSRWPAVVRQRQAALSGGDGAMLAALLRDPAATLPADCLPGAPARAP